jgi:glycosyltransferase involved in cell wall biosynthesis
MARSVFYFIDSTQLGGTEEALLLLLEHLDRSAWRPTLLCHDGPGIRELPRRAAALDVEVQTMCALPLGWTGISRVPAFVRELRRRRPLVFHAHLSWPLAAKYPLLASVLAGTPATIATVQLFPDFRLDRSNYLQERFLSRRVSRYIAVSRDIASRLAGTLGWPSSKIEVIHNGVAVDRLAARFDPELRRQLAAGEDTPIVLAVGRLDPQKGLDILLRAVPHVPRARFVIAGDGPERSRLEAQARAAGVLARVSFLGRRADVPELLAASDLFVLPSLYEGSSLALLEAMAAGKPVVTSAIAGTNELLTNQETGLLVAPGDPDALAAGLRRVLRDAELRDRLGTAARTCVAERFSAADVADRVTRVYERVLRSNRNGG